MRIPGFGLQPDFDRNLLEVIRLQAAPRDFRADPQHLLLADIERDVDRTVLNDGCQFGSRATPDQRADRDLAGADISVKRRFHLGIAEIDLRILDLEFGLIELRTRRVAIGEGLIELGLRYRRPAGGRCIYGDVAKRSRWL